MIAAALVLLLAPAGQGQAPLPEQRLLFLGDSGSGSPEQFRVRDQMLLFAAPLVFLLGDNIYEHGDPTLFGPYYDNVYRPLLEQGAAFHAALGNHDVHHCVADPKDPLPADGTAYHRWLWPCEVRAQLAHGSFGYPGGRRYYSVATDASPTPLGEVFVLDSNTLGSSQTKLAGPRQDRAQMAWLEDALLRSRARWKIVILHHPPQSPRVPGSDLLFFIPTRESRGPEVRLERQLAPVLRRGQVDAVFAGHNHFYARLYPQDGIRYFVSGGGGRDTYAFVPEEGYVASGGSFSHFVHVRLTAERFEYYAIDEAGHSRDAGWWHKGDARDQPLAPGTLPPPGR